VSVSRRGWRRVAEGFIALVTLTWPWFGAVAAATVLCSALRARDRVPAVVYAFVLALDVAVTSKVLRIDPATGLALVAAFVVLLLTLHALARAARAVFAARRSLPG
jgi:hypothetical protein